MGFSRLLAVRRNSLRVFRHPLDHWKEMDSERKEVGKAERQRTACYTDLKQRDCLSFVWGNLAGRITV
jgi:hypothetical protein